MCWPVLQICRQLSEQLEREQRRTKESLAALQASVCPGCVAQLERQAEEQGWPQHSLGGDCGRPQESAQLRQLELELAQTKLALVEAQCHNQDLTHQLSCAAAELQASKSTWLHKTLSSIREVARKEPAATGMTKEPAVP